MRSARFARFVSLVAVAASSLVAACATESPFLALTRVPLGRGVLFPSFADFDGDGKQDFVVARSSGRGEIVQYRGEGGGRFVEVRTLLGANPPRGLATGDLNGDGLTDLIATDFAWEGSATVFLGVGNGAFGAPQHYLAGRTPSSPKVVDVTGDGKPDLVIVNRRPEDQGATWIQHGAITVLPGGGDGTFQAPRTMNFGIEPRSLATGDLDGDGKIDLVVADDSSDPLAAGRRVTVLLGRGDGSFVEKAHYATRFGAGGITITDLNGDKKPDLIVRHTGLSILLGNGDGTFELAGDHVTGPAVALAVGDFNGDGQVDIASPRRILLGDGHGDFPSFLRYDLFNEEAGAQASDIDGDGKPDLLVLDGGHNRLNVYGTASRAAEAKLSEEPAQKLEEPANNTMREEK